MTVHILMPVFNRLELTKKMIQCIYSQELDENISLVIVDDGSTDGTSEYLSKQDLTVLQGDGSLWWGGSIDIALRHIFTIAKPDDWVMFVNNDTQFKPDFLQCILDTARKEAPAAVGSIIRNEVPPYNLLSIGAKINPWLLFSSDKLNDSTRFNESDLPSLVEVDALSGRGVIFPLNVLKEIGGMRPKLLPHYLADYELSVRVKSAGYHLFVNTNAVVYSKKEFGNSNIPASFKERMFSVRSPTYLPAVLTFWWEASNWIQRLTMPFRLLAFLIFPQLRNAR